MNRRPAGTAAGGAARNRYPAWLYALLGSALLLALVYALPNFWPLKPAIQIAWADAGLLADDALRRRVAQIGGLEEGTLEPSVRPRYLTYSFASTDQQLRAHMRISQGLGTDGLVALNFLDSTPQWLRDLGAGPLRLGLDLRGGVHFLMELDDEGLFEERRKSARSGVLRDLRTERIRYAAVSERPDGLFVELRSADDLDRARELLKDNYPSMLVTAQGSRALTLEWTPAGRQEILEAALEQNITALRNRVNELGVAEPLVQKQGSTRIVVQLPGVRDAAEARRLIGKTATLEFRLEADSATPFHAREDIPFRDDALPPAELETEVVVTGDNVVNARASYDENNQPVVLITLDSDGGSAMFRTTRDNIGRAMGVVMVESKLRTGPGGAVERVVVRGLLTLPTIRGNFGDRFQIEGIGDASEASDLALLLRAGALAAPMDFVEERVVGPSLGYQNIQAGVRAAILGMAAVVLFMIFWYRVMGLIANLALAANVLLIVALMSLLGATLTLPGIAGIVLTMGMAVDANVLILARIREELAAGAPVGVALHNGYDRAFVTIVDANITTLLTALILYAVGTGPVRGFAVTLSIGILTSMFTAILISRSLANLVYGHGRSPQRMSI